MKKTKAELNLSDNTKCYSLPWLLPQCYSSTGVDEANTALVEQYFNEYSWLKKMAMTTANVDANADHNGSGDGGHRQCRCRL